MAIDVLDENGNNDVTEARKDMGDPLHSRPATVIYGGPADDPDITLYATTNDGYLQAVNCEDRRGTLGVRAAPDAQPHREAVRQRRRDFTRVRPGRRGAGGATRSQRQRHDRAQWHGHQRRRQYHGVREGQGVPVLRHASRRLQHHRPRRDGTHRAEAAVGHRTVRVAGRRPELVRTHGRAGQRQPHLDQQQPRQDGAGVRRRLRRRRRTRSATWRTVSATRSSWWTPSPAA